MTLLTIDLWVLLKARRYSKSMMKLLTSLFQVVLLMALGAGVLIAYTLAHDRTLNSPVYTDEYPNARVKPAEDGLLSMETVSIAESSYLQQKLENLKNQALDLESNLKEMKTQYKDLSKIAHSNRRDEELADFASEAAGGTVLDTPDTESYYEPRHQQTTLFGIPIWKAAYFTPRKVIQPWTEAGECWAFKGSRGKIMIELAYPTLIDQVTLEHIPASASLTGSISSAPRDVVLYGLIDQTFMPLDSFTYDINGPSSQTFKLKDKAEVDMNPVKTILIEVESNWGHRDYTCIYRLKVHGKLSTEKNYREGNYIDGGD